MASTEHATTRLGRPPLDPAKARTERVVTFLTPPEMAALSAIAERRRQSLSATCHALLADALATGIQDQEPK